MNRVKRLRRADDHRRFRFAVERIERVARPSAAAQIGCMCEAFDNAAGFVQWECPWHGVQSRSPLWELTILSTSDLSYLHSTGVLQYVTPLDGWRCLACIGIRDHGEDCPIGPRWELKILTASELRWLHASGRLFYRTPKRTVATYEFTARPMGNGCLGCLAINVRAVYCPIGAKHG